MNKMMVITGLVIFVTGFTATLASACNCGKSTKSENSMPPSCQCTADSCGSEELSVKDAVAVNNTVCPVSGKPIGSMGEGVTSTYQGKMYRLCCGGCVAQFKSDPGKYIKKTQENG